MKKTFKSTLKECLIAYQDNHEEQVGGERNTNFKATHGVTGQEFVQIINRCNPNGYNEFDAIAAENVRALFGDEAEYTIARESSVCIYVKPKGKVCLNRKVRLTDLKADELSYEGEGVFRIWWD